MYLYLRYKDSFDRLPIFNAISCDAFIYVVDCYKISDDAKVFPTYYNVFQCDRKTDLINRAFGGGALLALKSNIKAEHLDVLRL